MKNLIYKLVALICLVLTFHISTAQQIDINSGFGSYEPGVFPGYSATNPSAKGVFYASAGKTSGTIPAYTAQITVTLAPEIPWTGEAFVIPAGWELDPASTPINLTFYNSTDWIADDPFFEIPVRAIMARSSQIQNVGTQVMNTAGDWNDDGLFNATWTKVQVADVPLPVTLISFTVSKENKTALLQWATTAETNSDRFEIERSLNGKNWNKIGTVASNGESKVLRNYGFTDVSPLHGENLYRLRMVDKDNSFAYSRIRSIGFEAIGSVVSVYPNPATDQLFIPNFDKVKDIVINDLSGKQVNFLNLSTSAPVSSGQIDVKNLVAGMYVIKVRNLDGTQYTQKFVVQK